MAHCPTSSNDGRWRTNVAHSVLYVEASVGVPPSFVCAGARPPAVAATATAAAAAATASKDCCCCLGSRRLPQRRKPLPGGWTDRRRERSWATRTFPACQRTLSAKRAQNIFGSRRSRNLSSRRVLLADSAVQLSCLSFFRVLVSSLPYSSLPRRQQ